MKPVILFGLLFFLGVATVAQAASFDCARAKSKIERKICADPALSKADEALAQIYKEELRTFPIPEFIKDSQRAWLDSLAQCIEFEANKDGNDLSCIGMYRARIDSLAHYGSAKLYTNYGKIFSHDDVTLLVYDKNGAQWLEWYGAWMPDAYRPKPFPNGYLAQDGAKLIAKDGKFTLADHDDAIISISDEKINFGGQFGMSLSARQGMLHGDYLRVK